MHLVQSMQSSDPQARSQKRMESESSLVRAMIDAASEFAAEGLDTAVLTELDSLCAGTRAAACTRAGTCRSRVEDVLAAECPLWGELSIDAVGAPLVDLRDFDELGRRWL